MDGRIPQVWNVLCLAHLDFGIKAQITFREICQHYIRWQSLLFWPSYSQSGVYEVGSVTYSDGISEYPEYLLSGLDLPIRSQPLRILRPTGSAAPVEAI